MILLPAFSHGIEFCVHFLRGTPKLKDGIIASVVFTAVSTLFNLYAMRRGILIGGKDEESKSFWSDMKAMPGVIRGFLAMAPLYLWKSLKGTGQRP